MAGTVDILQRCYTGLEFRDDMLVLNPKIPHNLPALSMKLKFRGNWFDLAVTSEMMTVRCDQCAMEEAKISFREIVHRLQPGGTLTFGLSEKTSGGDVD